MRILLTGIHGQVGHALLPKLNAYDVVGLSRAQLDLSSPDEIRRVVRDIKPHLIINPAAYTAVDKAESEPDIAFAINAMAPKILAEEARLLGAGLIHFSTDYVYDGTKATPYVETDTVNPVSVYGQTKLQGEDAIREVGLPHLILRTSWVYGAHGKNFLKTILRLAAERENLRVVADQFGAPTSAESIATACIELVQRWDMKNENQSGTYHFTNNGVTSWHGFSVEIIALYTAMQAEMHWPALRCGADCVDAITTADYPTPAKRPTNSRLDSGKLKTVFDITLPDWQVALAQVMRQLRFD